MGVNYTQNEEAIALLASSIFQGIEQRQTTQCPDLCIRPVILLSVNLRVYPFLPSILKIRGTGMGLSSSTWLNIWWALSIWKPTAFSSRKSSSWWFSHLYCFLFFLQLLPINGYGNPGGFFPFLTSSALLSNSSSSLSIFWKTPPLSSNNSIDSFALTFFFFFNF